MHSENARGALFMVLCMAAFVLNDALMKLILGELPLFQALFLRGVFSTFAFYMIARHMGALKLGMGRRDATLVVLRVVAEAGSAYFFLTALRSMPLANLTAILQALPLTITLAGALFLSEAVGWRRFAAIAVGFVGVLLIVRPDADGFDANALMALAAVGCVTVRELVTRRMSRALPTMAVAFYTVAGLTVFALAGSVGEDWIAPAVSVWGLLAAAVICITVGNLFSILAVRSGELGFVTPFRYTGLVWALALGYVVFGDWPDALTLAGAALIVATGLFTFYRERRVARRAARLATQAEMR